MPWQGCFIAQEWRARHCSAAGDAFIGRIGSILVTWGSELVLLLFLEAHNQCITQTVLRAMKDKWGVRSYHRGTSSPVRVREGLPEEVT